MLKKAGLRDDDILAAKAQLHGFEFRSIVTDQVDKNAFSKGREAVLTDVILHISDLIHDSFLVVRNHNHALEQH